jgi:hypothetical protein
MSKSPGDPGVRSSTNFRMIQPLNKAPGTELSVIYNVFGRHHSISRDTHRLQVIR